VPGLVIVNLKQKTEQNKTKTQVKIIPDTGSQGRSSACSCSTNSQINQKSSNDVIENNKKVTLD
jgi:hypothetical protein